MAIVGFDPIIVATVIIYLGAVILIGLWSTRETESTEDFLITGKRFGIWAVSFATFASVMSGFGFIGGPGLFYSGGYAFLWIAIVAPLSIPMSWYVLGKRMRLLTEVKDVFTVPDAAYARFNSDTVRFVTALAVLLGVISYLSVQIKSIGFVLAEILGTTQITALIIGMVVIGIYTVGGGMIAGVTTDLIQGAVMVVASVLVFFATLQWGGGFAQMSQEIALNKPKMAGAFGSFPVILGLCWYFLFIVGNSGQPHVEHKLFMLKDPKLLKWGPPIAGLSYFLSSLMMLGIGISMRAAVEAGRLAPLQAADNAAPYFLAHFTPSVLAGIVFAGTIGAIMSTSDAFINIGAANLARDIPQSLGFKYKSDKQELIANRIASAVIIIGSVLLAYQAEILVGILGVVGWGLFAATLVPILGIGLNWKGATKEGAIAGGITSLGLNLILAVSSYLYGFSLPNGIVEGALSLIVAIIVMIGVSFVTSSESREELPNDIKNVIEA